MPGYPSLVVGLMVLGGVQLIMIGIVGEYIGKILSEQKARPVYFVAEQNLKTAESERKDARCVQKDFHERLRRRGTPMARPNRTDRMAATTVASIRSRSRRRSTTCVETGEDPSSQRRVKPPESRHDAGASGCAPTITAFRPASTTRSAN